LNYEDRIIEALKKSSNGLSINDIAQKAGISKTAAIKYLATFRMAGKADFVESGSSRLWRLMVPKEKRKKKKTFVFTGKKIDEAVKEFVEENGLLGFAIVDNQGLTVSAVLPKSIDAEKLGALTTLLLRTGEKIVNLASLGNFKQLILETSKGKMLAYSKGKVLLLAFCKPETLLGAIRLGMEEFADKIKDLLK